LINKKWSSMTKIYKSWIKPTLKSSIKSKKIYLMAIRANHSEPELSNKASYRLRKIGNLDLVI